MKLYLLARMESMRSIWIQVLYKAQMSPRARCGPGIMVRKNPRALLALNGCRLEGYARIFVGENGRLEIADGCRIQPYVSMECYKNATLRIGAGTWVNSFARFAAKESIRIGERCLIGEGASFQDFSHDYDKDGQIRSSSVRIGDGCMIGAKATVLPGVEIGEGSVVGANAVVTHNIPERSVAMGVPAKVTRNLGVEAEREVWRGGSTE